MYRTNCLALSLYCYPESKATVTDVRAAHRGNWNRALKIDRIKSEVSAVKNSPSSDFSARHDMRTRKISLLTQEFNTAILMCLMRAIDSD